MRYAAAVLPVFGVVAMVMADTAFSESYSRAGIGGREADTAAAAEPKTGTAGRPAAAEGTKFATLSPPNRKIAHALYLAQQFSGRGEGTAAPDSRSAWSLDRIAAAKEQSRDWGDVFRRMQADRVIDGPSLAHIIGQEWIREFHEEKDAGRGAASASDVVVTYTNNRSSVVVTRGHPGYTAVRSNSGTAAGKAGGHLEIEDGTRR